MQKIKKYKVPDSSNYDDDDDEYKSVYNQDDYCDYQTKSKKIKTSNLESNLRDPNQLNERTRLVSINEAFEILRSHIPTFPYERRLSKIDTLHLAISYINLLESVLESNLNLYDYFQCIINQMPHVNQFCSYQISKPIWATSDLTVRLNWLNWNGLGVRNDQISKFLTLFQLFAECKKDRKF